MAKQYLINCYEIKGMEGKIMNNYVELVYEGLGEKTKENGLKTADIRRLSNRLFRMEKNRNIEDVFSVCHALLEERKWELGVVAFDWASRMKEQYTVETYDIFYKWLIDYVRGWGDCDDFCTHAFGELIRKYPCLFEKIVSWTTCEFFWVRRASAVVLLPCIWQEEYAEIEPFVISDALMYDDNKLVLKGYGWMLKIYASKEEELVFDYLMKNKANMPRTSFRYAMEKMPQDKRELLMK